MKLKNLLSVDKLISLQIDEIKVESMWIDSETPREYTDNEHYYIEKVEDKIYLEECLNCLNREELRIIKLRYGLDNDISKTQREVAHYLDIPQSYVSRLERVAFRKMRRLVDER